MRTRQPGPARFRHPLLALALLALTLAGCAGKGEPEQVEQPVDQLYNEALDLLQADDPKKAAKSFEEVERQHPYSQWATRAQMMAAYAYYEANDYDDAVDAARRFIELHPGHQDVAYAYYLIGICYYEQISDVGRDQKMTEDALDAFDELIRRFPGQQIRPRRPAQGRSGARPSGRQGDGRSAATICASGKFVAAINRFRTVVENYQTTTHVPEALHRLTEAYLSLGLTDEAQPHRSRARLQLPGQRAGTRTATRCSTVSRSHDARVAGVRGEGSAGGRLGERAGAFGACGTPLTRRPAPC